MVDSLPMTRPAALRRVRALAETAGAVVFRPHARQRRVERNMETRAILDVLRKGQIVEGPALDAHGCWRCTMRRFLRSEIATVVAALCEGKLVIVTAYEERS